MDYSSLIDSIKSRENDVLVEKSVPLQFDLGNMAAFDIAPIDTVHLSNGTDEYLKLISRDNTQLLINQLFDLPIRRVENAVLAKLPSTIFEIPREKSVPLPKMPTRWENFAKTKGIEKHKRSRNIWDEEKKMWKPRHGYDRANDDTKDWMVELPDTGDVTAAMKDSFSAKRKAKSARILKNSKNQSQNIARNMKVKRTAMSKNTSSKKKRKM